MLKTVNEESINIEWRRVFLIDRKEWRDQAIRCKACPADTSLKIPMWVLLQPHVCSALEMKIKLLAIE